MNRKTLVLSTFVITLTLFLAGGWYVSQQSSPSIAPMANNDAADLPAAVVQNVDKVEDVLVRAYSPIMGPKDAPVTIVEFFDPACEACRAFYPILKQIMAEFPNDVRVVVRYTPFHGEGSELAILILEVARLQNLFIPVKEALLDNQEVWASHGAPDTSKIMAIAVGAGLDLEKAATQIKSPSIVGVLNQDRADVETVGIKQTPTFFVNGEPLVQFGAKELMAQVREAVENARKDGE